MRRPPARFTVRGAMLAVAAIACSIGLTVGIQRRAERFRRLAAAHDEAVGDLIMQAGGPVSGTDVPGHDSERLMQRRGAEAVRAWRASEYHDRLAEKYRRAARYPWLPVAPDPPEPE